jgi:hypothetical protein
MYNLAQYNPMRFKDSVDEIVPSSALLHFCRVP